MLLEAHKWTGKEALRDGIVDEVSEPEEMFEAALRRARDVAPRAKMGVYARLRGELWGEAGEGFRRISYVHGKDVGTVAKAKI
jgi:enoyl-CoA hydratase/carnithine racemase